MTRLIIKNAIRYIKKHPGEESQFISDVAKAFTGNFPKVLFFLLPIYAFLLKILYFRHNMYYSEHLVFSVTVYNFYYLLFSIAMLLALIPGLGWLPLPAAILVLVYQYIGMKNMYKQSWIMTIVKFILFGLLFNIFILAGLFVNFIITLVTL